MSGHSTFEPKNPVIKWIERRLPVFGLMHGQFIVFPMPRNVNYWWTFGGILFLFLAIQLITGIVLAMHYVPHTSFAFESVEHIMRDVNWGWLLRYVHANGGSFFFLAAYIHLFRGLYYGSYKEPREIIWIVGVAIIFVMILTAFMGYSLVWGQMSFWAVTVITNLMSVVPFVGEQLTQWVWGGYSVDQPTLVRLYALHYLMPFVIAVLVAVHVWALHVTGSNNPEGVEVKSDKDTLPFHPFYTMKDGYAMVVMLVAFFAVTFFAPNLLSHPDNYIQANPLVTPSHIVPEWYFLPFYAMLRAVPDKLGGVIVMMMAIMILFVLPWLDTSKVKSARYRPLYRQFFWIFLATCIGLGYLGAAPAEGAYVIWARILTAYYFIHFLVIFPVLGLVEKTKPVPNSISEAVLAKSKKKAGGEKS